MAAYSKFDGSRGDSIHLQEIVRNLSEKNELIVITQIERGKPIIVGNAKIMRMKVLSIWRDLSIAIAALLKGLYISRTFKPDVIYERVENYGIGCLLGKINKIPVVIEINGLLSDERRTTQTYNPIQDLFFVLSNKFNMRLADKIIVVTQGIKSILLESYHIPEKKIIVLGNGANIDLFKPMDKLIVKQNLKLDEHSFYICFVGNFVPWQGVEYLIKAVSLIVQNVKNIKILIVGDGIMRTEWEDLVIKLKLSDYFIFTGIVPHKDVPKYINASDICVAPFIRDRNEKIGLSPLKIYEYLACEKPVVGSNIKGVGDFLEASNIGFSFTPEDHVELADVLLKLLHDGKLRYTMGKNGRKIIVEKYNWKLVANKIENVCADVVLNRSTPSHLQK